MARLARALGLASVFLFVLGACAGVPAKSSVVLPDRLVDQGLVIADVYGFAGQQVQIDGKTRAYLHNNRLVLPLAPGEYTLTGISERRQYGNTVNTTTLPLERRFEIKSGKVTNLGLILFEFDPQEKSKFYTYLLDNTASARRQFHASQPAFAAGLGAADFLTAPGPYIAADKLDQLRRMLAVRRTTNNISKPGLDPRIVTGPAGLLAEYVIQGGKVVDIKVHETNTLAAAVDRSEVGEQNLVAMADGSLFLLHKGRLQTLGTPADAAPLVKAELLPGGMLLVDERMRAFWSTDGGQSWERYTEAALAGAEAIRNIYVEKGARNLFVYNKSQPARILHTSVDRLAPTSIPVPLRSVENIGKLVSRGSGVFLEQAGVNLIIAEKLYFRPANGGEWEVREAPGASCMFDYGDDVGTTLTAKCGFLDKNKHYRSTDGGRSWAQL